MSPTCDFPRHRLRFANSFKSIGVRRESLKTATLHPRLKCEAVNNALPRKVQIGRSGCLSCNFSTAASPNPEERRGTQCRESLRISVIRRACRKTTDPLSVAGGLQRTVQQHIPSLQQTVRHLGRYEGPSLRRLPAGIQTIRGHERRRSSASRAILLWPVGRRREIDGLVPTQSRRSGLGFHLSSGYPLPVEIAPHSSESAARVRAAHP